MKIAVLLNCHDYPNLVLDTLESIRTWVSDDVAIMIDDAGWNKFSFIHWGNTKVIRGLFHNFHKSPYRSVSFGLQKIYELFPDYDWYIYVEYDCLFTSSSFLDDLKNKTGISCLACDIRHHSGDLPVLDKIIGEKIEKYSTMLGCCVFYSGKFIKKLIDTNFFNRFLEATSTFEKGKFPDYRGYAFEETLYPTLVKHFGGNVFEIGAWRKDVWSNTRYLMRFRPNIEITDLATNASVVHPLKVISDCSVRIKYKKMREKYLSWSDKVIEGVEINPPDKKLQYIVCGTGRSGTAYFTGLLNSVGVSCGHERIFINKGCTYKNYGYNSGSSEWAGIKQIKDPTIPLDAEASYMAAPYLRDEFLGEARVVHLVRHPINVINSFVNGIGYFKDFESDYEKYILKYLPELRDISDPLLRAAYYYVHWNQMIESVKEEKPYIRFCVENNVVSFIKLIGKNSLNYYKNTKCNSVVDMCSLSWSDIPEGQIKNDLVSMYKKYYKKSDII